MSDDRISKANQQQQDYRKAEENREAEEQGKLFKVSTENAVKGVVALGAGLAGVDMLGVEPES